MPVVLTEDIASQHIDDFNAANPSPFAAASTPGGGSDLSNPTLQAPTLPVAPDMGVAAPSSPPAAAAPTPPLTADAPVTAPLANPSSSVTPTSTADGHAFSPYDNIFAKYAGAQANNPEFLAIVAAGTKAESQWDTTNTTGDGGHSWGLFQMHDHGAGSGMGNTRLDPDTASSVMVPAYVASYNAAKSRGLTGAALAAATAQGAEHSADDTGAAYSKAWNEIMGQPTYTGPQAVSGQSSPAAAPSTSQAPAGSESTQGAAATLPSPDDHIQAFNQANPSPFDQIKSAVGGAASAAGTTVQDHIDALNATLGNPFDTVGRIANDVTSPQAAMSDLSGVIGGDSGVNQARQQFAPSVLDASSPHDARDPNTALNVVAGVDGGGSGGGKGLVDAQAAVDALRARFPQMSEGSIAASGAGKDLAAAQAAQAAPPTNGYPSYPAPLQPPTPAPAAALDSTDVMQGLLNMLKSSGTHDAAQIDALQGQIDSLKPQPEVAPTNSAPSTAVADSPPAVTFDSQGNQLSGPAATPPLDEHANIPSDIPPANPNQVVTPQGTLAPGDTNIPGRQGGAVPPATPDVDYTGQPTAPVPPGLSVVGQAGKLVSGTLANAKNSLFSLSNFHALTIGEGTLFGPAGPSGAMDFIAAYAKGMVKSGGTAAKLAGDLAPWAERAQQTGLLREVGANPEVGTASKNINVVGQKLAQAAGGAIFGGAGGYAQAKQRGLSDDDARVQAVIGAGIGAIAGPTVGVQMHNALWTEGVPLAKVLTFKAAVEGGASDVEAAKFTANLLGGQNLGDLTDRVVHNQVVRLVAMAPDFWASQLKLAADAGAGLAKSVPGVESLPKVGPMTSSQQISRDTVIKMVATGAFVTEALQRALTGHFTNENQPGHEMQLEVPVNGGGKAGYTTYSLFPGNVQPLLDLAAETASNSADRATGLGRYVRNRLGPAGMAINMASDQQYPNGPPITPRGSVGATAGFNEALYAASHYAPIAMTAPQQATSKGAPLPAVIGSMLSGVKMGHDGPSASSFTAPAPAPSARPVRPSARPPRPTR